MKPLPEPSIARVYSDGSRVHTGERPSKTFKGARHAEWFMVALTVFACAVGVVTGVLFFHTRYITQTRTHTITRSPYQHPSQSIPGAQVNSQLAGFTCDVYQSPQAIVCHH